MVGLPGSVPSAAAPSLPPEPPPYRPLVPPKRRWDPHPDGGAPTPPPRPPRRARLRPAPPTVGPQRPLAAAGAAARARRVPQRGATGARRPPGRERAHAGCHPHACARARACTYTPCGNCWGRSAQRRGVVRGLVLAGEPLPGPRGNHPARLERWQGPARRQVRQATVICKYWLILLPSKIKYCDSKGDALPSDEERKRVPSVLLPGRIAGFVLGV